MLEKLRVAIIGAGIASRHLDGYSRLEERFDVKVLCSLDIERGRSLCDKRCAISSRAGSRAGPS